MTLKHIRTRFLIPAFLMICLILSGCKDKTVTHTVTFDSNGGSEVAAQEVMNGKSAVEPKSPEKEGFTFTEWLLDDTAFDFTSPITQDITLTASYTVNEGTEIILVTFDAANKSSAKEVEIIKGGTVTPPADPSLDGFEFAGWYLDGKEFDFSTPLSENVTLRAKWNKVETTEEAEGSEEESSKESKPGAVGNKPGSSQGQQDGNTPTTPGSSSSATTSPSQKVDPEALTAQYSGIWYLQGYADIYLDIRKDDNYMRIEATNFSLSSGLAPIFDANAFILYPKNCNYSSSITIDFPTWQEDLARAQTTLGNNCIYINQYRFVRAKGTTDRYSGTCYRAALGTWYLQNHPNSKLIIETCELAPSPWDSDRFSISPINFDLTTLVAGESNCSTVYGTADQQSDFDRYGISVSNGVLRITNSHGTCVFHKTPTSTSVTGITLDHTTLSLSVGESFTLKAIVSPANATDSTVTWKTSNSSVASVNYNTGHVVCKKVGKVIITATTKDGNYQASCELSISDPNAPVRVTAITISQTTANMYLGDTLQLSASVIPSNATNQNIYWTCRSDGILAVSDSGLVTALEIGISTITVKSVDGLYEATCKITVSERPTAPAPLEAHASIGTGEVATDTGIHKIVTASIYTSGGSGIYTYQMNVYRNGILIGSFNTDHEELYNYTSGIFYIEFTVTDSTGQSISGRSHDCLVN